MKTTEFNIPSISCGSCSEKIQKAIKRMSGINNVSIDLKTQMVNIEYDPQQVEAHMIKDKINNMGYEVVG